MAVIARSFFERDDVLVIARELLGKFLYTRLPVEHVHSSESISDRGVVTGGRIVEVEAYRGITDRASHAYGGRRTKRTETMYMRGGVVYVYLCYGMHALLNIVTNTEGVPDAILIRAIKPERGVPAMLKRRGMRKIEPRLTRGPGSVTKALGITVAHDTQRLKKNLIWVEDGDPVADQMVLTGPRVGVDYAGPDAMLPWRFMLKETG